VDKPLKWRVVYYRPTQHARWPGDMTERATQGIHCYGIDTKEKAVEIAKKANAERAPCQFWVEAYAADGPHWGKKVESVPHNDCR